MRFGPFFLGTIFVGGAFGWFAPDHSQPGQGGAGEKTAPRKERLEVTRREQWRDGEIVLPRADDGHFYAEVSTDSGAVMMLVDTGASVVALTGNDASMMGVDWRESDVRPVARGASGDVYGVPVMLDRLQVGELEARQVQAIVVPEDLDISLLGQSFLTKMNRVEMNGDEMILGD